jgi:hypothetical protein
MIAMVRDRIYNLLKLAFDKADNLTRQTQQKKLGVFINLAMITLMLAFVGIYVVRQWSTLREFELSLNLFPFLYGLGLLGFNFILFILVWNLLIQVFNGAHSLVENALIYSYSQIAKLLPTPIWFISARLLLYNRSGITKRSVLIATALETAFHAWIGFIIFCILSIKINVPITWLFSLGIPITILILRALISSKSNQIQLDRNIRIKNAFGLIGLFTLTWITAAPFLTLTIQGVTGQSSVPTIEIWKIWIIASIFSYIGSYTLGGIGVIREFSLVLLLGKFYSPPVCLVIAVISRIIMTIGNLVWPGAVIGLIKGANKITQTNYHPVDGKDDSTKL